MGPRGSAPDHVVGLDGVGGLGGRRLDRGGGDQDGEGEGGDRGGLEGEVAEHDGVLFRYDETVGYGGLGVPR
ncbi:hypothetical protein BU197_19090 [Streptomyces sp. CBMA291]|nr:hypothetical protein [Streptomyces sp. CBMA291]MBD0712738.1 hypothetical protein [Streptomyces sp. CBMA370]